MSESTAGLFARVDQFPNSKAENRLKGIVGHSETIKELVAHAVALLDARGVEKWSKQHHRKVITAATALMERAPVFVFAGDVGVGKTEVAEVLGQAIAVEAKVGVTLYPLSLTARGRGAVGEMTTLLTNAFEILHSDFSRTRAADGHASSMGILLIDEADAIAQSRELAQMHHEDRAGVNALLRGIDGLRADNLPVLTILCTNRLEALDPAIQRRAAAIQTFERPTTEQRADLLGKLLEGSSLTAEEIQEIAESTGGTKDRTYGFTYSDLRQRLIPQVALTAYRHNKPIDFRLVREVLARTTPTRPFEGMA